MKETMCIKKLDAENLKILMRRDPVRIEAEEATPEAGALSKHEQYEDFLTQMEQLANSNGPAYHYRNTVTVQSLDLMNLIRIIRGENISIGICDDIGASDYVGLRKVTGNE